MEFWTVLPITIVLCCTVFSTTLGIETTYVVALLGQDIQNGSTTASIEYELVIVNEESTQITVIITSIDGPVKTLLVDSNARVSHKLGHEMAMNGSEISNKSLEVHSDVGKFVLQVFTKRDGYIEGLLALPIQQMDGPNQVINRTVYEYVVATFCAVGGYCQIAIAATENNTEVFIDIPKMVEEIAFCNKSSYFRLHRDTGFTMNKFDAFQLETTYDLTGTVIFSFKPIAVFVGSRNVTNGNIVAHTMEQLVPSSHWGTEFVVQTLGSNGYGDILKIVSHYTSTVVTMSGFPSFNMTNRYQNVTRRLSKGTRSHIQASHPIQVVQISGLSYATENESSTLTMTVVPSVQNAWNDFTVSCHDMQTSSQFVVVSEKTACSNTSAGGQLYLADSNGKTCGAYDFESRIKYTKYLIGTINGTSGSNILKVSNPRLPINGIVKCGDTVTMPLGVLYNTDVSGTTPFTVPEHNGGICYEGGQATTYFSPSGDVPYMLNFTDYKMLHVFKLRVQVCGSAILRFTTLTGEFIVAIISYQGIQIIACEPQCTFNNGISYMTNSINEQAGTECETDMSFFWVMQNVGMFCIGTGYHHKPEMCARDVSNSDNLIRIETNSDNFFDAVSMTGQFSDATFNWDFIHVNGCKEYKPGWRCTDKLSNCSQYEDGFCTTYHDFASKNCAKFCGICFADSYGKKFLLRTPYRPPAGQCSILVSPLNPHTHVAVTMLLVTPSSEQEVVLHGIHDLNAITYNCSEALHAKKLNTITILSDDDVAAVLYLEINEPIRGTRLYPVDAFGNEFMILEHSKAEKECRFVSEDDTVEYVSYYFRPKQNQKGAADSERTTSDIYTLLKMDGIDMSGTSWTFTKSSSVFCFDKTEFIYTQLLPVDTWSNEYVVPGFDIDAVKHSLTGMLHIISTADNTIVNISGGFDAFHAIYDRGDRIEQEIDIAAGYKIEASERIAVGLYINDSINTGMTSFSLLAPVQNHHDTVLTAVPYVVFDDGIETETVIYTSYINAYLDSEVNQTTEADSDLSYRVITTGEVIYEMTLVHSDYEWLLVPGNIKARYLNEPKKICSISAPAHGDGIDNDCDGLIDEDGFYADVYGVYKEDHDLDGDFGEDCGGTIIQRPVVVTAPKQPMCLNFTGVPGQCWVPYSCPCSWLKRMEKYQGMTHEELVDALRNDTKEILDSMKLNKELLTATIITKESAGDDRKSAQSIGFVGVALFAVIFGTVFIMDINALKRDALILWGNLSDGAGRVRDFVTKCCKKKATEPK